MPEDENYGGHTSAWMYRSSIDRRYWHAWFNGVHIWWNVIVDDFGNLVHPFV
jgi:hypothetical protein